MDAGLPSSLPLSALLEQHRGACLCPMRGFIVALKAECQDCLPKGSCHERNLWTVVLLGGIRAHDFLLTMRARTAHALSP